MYPARKVPQSQKQKLKKELDRLVQTGVLVKAERPTDWVLPLVIVEKPNGDLRLCLDPMDLNEYTRREHCHLPHRSEILSEMAHARYFTKMDASQGFYQIQLDEESTQLCTVATPFGRYSFKRLPYGINCAPEIFHAKIQQLFECETGVKVFMDDIVVWGRTREEHDARLKRALATVRRSGLKLNEKKCVFGVTELTYLGEKLTHQGVKPDPDKVAGICNMPVPTTKEEVQRALGMVNYMAKFVPNLTVKTTALRQLLLEKNDWQWEAEQAKEWQSIKDFFTTEPLLKFYDPARRSKISSDASKDGLGAVLLQEHDGNWLPVAFISRAMTSAEKNYAQIEKELLGLVFACEKFHEYVYGATVIGETDHKPLVSLHKKNLCDLTPRLQRMMLRLRRYDLKLEFKPGKYLIVADTLSRAFDRSVKKSNTEEEIKAHVDVVRHNAQVSDPMWEKIAIHTKEDEVLQDVMNAVHFGWEKFHEYVYGATESDQAQSLKPYYHFRGDITEIDGVLVKGSKVIIPKMLQGEMLKKIHEGHLGIEKCQARARQVMYWPNINNDIENHIGRCGTCQKHRYKQAKEPMEQHEVPEKPWRKIGADLFTLFGKNFLVVVDYTSNYPEVAKLEDLSSTNTISHMKSIMARHGLPSVVVSDNGPQFSSREFTQFAKQYGFKHVTSSPEYPQSNGKAEKAVQIVKRLLKKAKENDEDPYLALLYYRASPLPGSNRSPGEMSMNRKLRTKLPSAEEHVTMQKLPDIKQKRYYDRGSSQLKPLETTDTVRVRSDGVWSEKAQVLASVAPNSYLVELERGRRLRRNRRHLLKTQEKFMPVHEDDDNDDDREKEVCVDHPSGGATASRSQSAVIQEAAKSSHSTEQSQPVSTMSDVRTTRSGRIIKLPSRYVYD